MIQKEKRPPWRKIWEVMLSSNYAILILITSLFSFGINFLPLLSSEQKVIAQISIEGLEPPANVTNFALSAANGTQLDLRESQIPIVEKLSDKGQYIVQLRWNPNPAVLLPKDGFDLTIYFMDPNVTEQKIEEEGLEPQGEEVEQGADIEQQRIGEPGSYIILPLLPVKSYAITISSDDGSVLWKKVNQMVTGGRAFERVVFTNEYTGPITIEINNITGGEIGTDSVTFNARIIST